MMSQDLTCASQVVAEITPIGLATLKYKYYIIYAAINICLTFPCKCNALSRMPKDQFLTTYSGVYFFFPETSGLHLEEVDAIFTDSSNIFKTVSIARRRGGIDGRSSNDKEKAGKKQVVEIEERIPTLQNIGQVSW